MSTNAHTEPGSKPAAPWWEILLVMAVSLGISLVLPSLKIIGILIPAVYLLVERRLRQRTWTEIGFNLKTFSKDLLCNLG
jgi:hypothetical protein